MSFYFTIIKSYIVFVMMVKRMLLENLVLPVVVLLAGCYIPYKHFPHISKLVSKGGINQFYAGATPQGPPTLYRAKMTPPLSLLLDYNVYFIYWSIQMRCPCVHHYQYLKYDREQITYEIFFFMSCLNCLHKIARRKNYLETLYSSH